MDRIDHSTPVSVFERGASEITGRLSISNIPLARALHAIQRWPKERRDGVLIETPHRTFPWADVNVLYRRLYHRPDRGGPT